MTPFEEDKGEEEAEKVVGAISKLIEEADPVKVFQGFAMGFVTAIISGGLFGLCWNHLAPEYFYVLPQQFHHISWWNSLVFCYMIRVVAIATRNH